MKVKVAVNNDLVAEAKSLVAKFREGSGGSPCGKKGHRLQVASPASHVYTPDKHSKRWNGLSKVKKIIENGHLHITSPTRWRML